MRQLSALRAQIIRGLYLPLSVLAVCGLLFTAGYMLCPSSMQGGEMATHVHQAGYLLTRIAGALTDNIGFLFAASSACTSRRGEGTKRALAGLMIYLIVTALLSPYTMRIVFYSASETALEPFQYFPQVFGGIACGLLAAWIMDLFFKRGKDYLCVIAVSCLAAALLAAVFGGVYFLLYHGLYRAGQWMTEANTAGTVLFPMLNRLLMPLNLHHALNRAVLAGPPGYADLNRYWANETAGDPGRFMSGFFPVMMGGIAGAVLALRRKQSCSKVMQMFLMLSFLASYLGGFSEPFEIAAAFSAPVLYIVHCLFYGVFAWLANLLRFRAGFALSGGLADLVFSAPYPAAHNTWMIIPLCALSFACYYFLYRKFSDTVCGRQLGQFLGSETLLLREEED